MKDQNEIRLQTPRMMKKILRVPSLLAWSVIYRPNQGTLKSRMLWSLREVNSNKLVLSQANQKVWSPTVPHSHPDTRASQVWRNKPCPARTIELHLQSSLFQTRPGFQQQLSCSSLVPDPKHLAKLLACSQESKQQGTGTDMQTRPTASPAQRPLLSIKETPGRRLRLGKRYTDTSQCQHIVKVSIFLQMTGQIIKTWQSPTVTSPAKHIHGDEKARAQVSTTAHSLGSFAFFWDWWSRSFGKNKKVCFSPKLKDATAFISCLLFRRAEHCVCSLYLVLQLVNINSGDHFPHIHKERKKTNFVI